MFRNFCYTINNPTEGDRALVEEFKEYCTYHVYALETGEEKETPHYQGYAELKKRTRLNKLKALLPRSHLEHRRGTAKQAADYCKKTGEYVEYGVLSKQGSRADLQTMYGMIKEGKSDVELQEANVGMYLRYYKGFDRVRQNLAREDKKFTPMDVKVIIGPPGTNKTRRAFEADPNLYVVDCTRDGACWFDGYTNERTILFDDFYGQLDISRFLKYLDGYRFNVPVKGGYVWKQWTNVIITSNGEIASWYGERHVAAISRRVGRLSITRPTSGTPDLPVEAPVETPNE